MRKVIGVLCGWVALGALPNVASAAPILGADPALEQQAAAYERQDDTFARAECGMNWDAHVKPADRALVEGFFAQTQDFKSYSGKDVFDVLDFYGEHHDQGNFSGIASVGLAARLMVLKRDGAPAAEIARARDAAVRAARTWHVFGTIAGPNTVARGVRRIVPEPGTGGATLPGATPELVPLKDAGGNPLPSKKVDSWRAPVAPGLTDWIWRDNTSKDQVVGYALGVLYLWDALQADPAVPKDVTADIAADLVRFAKNLMKVGPNGIDLWVVDADGRLTTFGDLNARVIFDSDIILAEQSKLKNGFNAALALAIIRAAYYVSGDAELKGYYYDELIKTREYPKHAIATAGLIYQNEVTNFSNVNMLAIAIATLGRVETDPTVRGQLYDLIDKFWSPGSQSRAPVNTQQPWFDVVVAGFGRAPKNEVPDRMRTNLLGHGTAPTFQRDRINCDEAEITAGSCLAVDGTTTLTLAAARGRGDQVVAESPVPLAVRPDTNFLWRTDPFVVNAGASNRLNPRGDWLAAYWLGRLLDRDPTKNVVTPSAPPTVLPDAGVEAATDAGAGASSEAAAPPGAAPQDDAGSESSGGCGCRTVPSAPASGAAMLFGLAALAFFRRRRQG